MGITTPTAEDGRYILTMDLAHGAGEAPVPYNIVTGWLGNVASGGIGNDWNPHYLELSTPEHGTGLPRNIGTIASDTEVLVIHSLNNWVGYSESGGAINAPWSTTYSYLNGTLYNYPSDDLKHLWLYNGERFLNIAYYSSSGDFSRYIGVFIEKLTAKGTFYNSLSHLLHNDDDGGYDKDVIKYAYVNKDQNFVFATTNYRYTENDMAGVDNWTAIYINKPFVLAYANVSNQKTVRAGFLSGVDNSRTINVSSDADYGGINVLYSTIGLTSTYITSIIGDSVGGGKFVCVTDLGEVVLSIDNGTTWNLQSTPLLGSALLSLTYGNGLFVVVGLNGLIATSPNGSTWTIQTSGTINNLLAVTYGNGIFVAAGAQGTILTSTNGTSWTIHDSYIGTNSITDLSFGNGTFVGIGGDSRLMIVSTNGINWSVQPNYDPRLCSATSTSIWTAITFAEGLGFFVAGNNQRQLYFSYDGIVWHDFYITNISGVATTSQTYVYSIAYVPYDSVNNFIVTTKGLGGFYGYYYYTSDGDEIVGEPGLGWTRVQIPVSNMDQFVRQYAFKDTGPNDSAYIGE